MPGSSGAGTHSVDGSVVCGEVAWPVVCGGGASSTRPNGFKSQRIAKIKRARSVRIQNHFDFDLVEGVGLFMTLSPFFIVGMITEEVGAVNT